MKAREALDLAMSEAAFQEWVCEYATLRKWAWWHDNDSRRNRGGLPDLLLVRPPTVLFVELKRQRGVLRAGQKAWRTLLERCPGVGYHVWRPSDRAAIERVLD